MAPAVSGVPLLAVVNCVHRGMSGAAPGPVFDATPGAIAADANHVSDEREFGNESEFGVDAGEADTGVRLSAGSV